MDALFPRGCFVETEASARTALFDWNRSCYKSIERLTVSSAGGLVNKRSEAISVDHCSATV